MAFPPVDGFVVVPPTGLAAATGIHLLAVDAGRVARVAGLLGPSHSVADGVVDTVQRAVVSPFVEIPPNRTLGRKILGQIASLAAVTDQIKDGVDDA
jgi:hypothetical protein